MMLPVFFDEGKYTLEEGFLSLDLVNTVDWRKSDHPEEDLPSYDTLLEWSANKGLIDADARQSLRGEALRRPDEAQSALVRVHDLRENLYKIFTALAHEQPIPPDALDVLNTYLAHALSHSRLVLIDGRMDWQWGDQDHHALDQMLWPVARSAAAILTSDLHGRIGECADDRGCGWIFFDATRNRSRRWCSMESCGNRAKAQRHYHRERSERKTPARAQV